MSNKTLWVATGVLLVSLMLLTEKVGMIFMLSYVFARGCAA